MELIFGFIVFYFACYVSFYLPGKLLLLRVFHFSPEETSFLSWPVGIGLFLLGIYLSAWIHLSYLYLGVVVGLIVYAFLRERSLFRISIKIEDKVGVGIIVFGSLIFLSLTAFSYLQTKEGLQFVGSINVMDGLLHVAYTRGLLSTFPPQHAGLAGVPLRGYHYFYDLMMSRLVLFYHLRPEDLYYRYLPFFISLIYGGGFLLLSSKVTNHKLSRWFVLFFAYFAQSFAFVLSFFILSIHPIAELGSIYPLELILNPAIILSIGMLLCFVWILIEAKPRMWQMIMVGFLFGIITELKVYTGIIGVSVFAAIVFLRIIKKRQNTLPYLLGLLTMSLVILITYVPNNFGAGNLWWSPFFAYSVYMQEPPFTSWHWELRRIIFRDHHNIPRLVLLYIQAIGLFWLLTLGSRVVFILGLPNLLKMSFWKKEANIAILVIVFLPILIGSLFVQSVSIFDIKQFFWIAGSLIALPAGVVIGNLLSKRRLIVQISVVMLIVGFSFAGIVGQVNAFVFRANPYVIPASDLVFFQNVQEILPQDSWTVDLLQKDKTELTNYPFNLGPTVAAMTNHPTYVEPENTIDFGKVYDERKRKIDSLQLMLTACKVEKIKKYIHQIGSKYVISLRNKCLEKIGSKLADSTSGVTLYLIKL